MHEELKEIAHLLPEMPGVYQFFDINDVIIYIGKAKNLRKRVLSYFTKDHDNVKLRILVRRIRRIEHIVLNTEMDAFLLENSLIKKYQPRYNVLLKDDKTYPWICVKNEPFPRIYLTRTTVKDGSEYFGPFTSGNMVKSLLDFLCKTYYIRTCSLNLLENKIKEKKFKSCLEFQLENCKAPCANLQTTEDYNTAVQQIRYILKGNIKEAIIFFKNQMSEFASLYKFEEAENAKRKMLLLENYQSKSMVVNISINNVDVFSIVSDEKSAFVNYFKVIQGTIIQSYLLEIKKRLNETALELLQMGIVEIRCKFNSSSEEIIVPFDIELTIDNTTITVPKKGDKKRLLELSEKNARYFQIERQKREEKDTSVNSNEKLLRTIQADLHLPRLPKHIECFDNSNLQGTNPVAACVVFRNAKPQKSEYRKFNIKTVEGIDDYASMREILFRRYSRMISENITLPDLIVIDGGKGQLKAACETLQKLNIHEKVSIISIAKRLEEIFAPNDSLPLYINKNSQTLKVIQHLRNEAHRFGISFHRDKRSKEFTKSILDEIDGIGEKTVQKLFEHYKTIDEIKAASLEELSKIIDIKKATIVYRFFKFG